ncbi:hypothetical protein GJ744_000542 [Endocarpon pusillum]|uniref:Uncharacterized protein n=1 Tax=Endocarpon pusillum TaxID=364733 RepID=A0A8H7E2H3_9EURO|nr:hypothetical protein GJ744_000542 [Endocarpon pusillum]
MKVPRRLVWTSSIESQARSKLAKYLKSAEQDLLLDTRFILTALLAAKSGESLGKLFSSERGRGL